MCACVALAAFIFFKHWRGGRWCRSCLPRRRRAPAGQAPRVPASPGGHLFPHMEVMSRSCKQGIARQEKDLGSESWKCFEKAKTKQKFSKSYSVSSELLELLAVSLHVFIFVCFQRLHLFSPLPDLLKKYQVNAKGHFQNSSELPKEERDPSLSPSREIPWASFRKARLWLFHSHSSLTALKCIIMQM